MAIRLRRGNLADFDKNKLATGELGLVLDAGKLYFCYSAGNTKQLQTAEDLQTMLNASGTAYTALQQLIADLNLNPSELTNILANISALQSGLGNISALNTTTKTSAVLAINEVNTNKFDKANIVATDTVNDNAKVAGAGVIYAHGVEIDAINNNLAPFLGGGLNTVVSDVHALIIPGVYGYGGSGITNLPPGFYGVVLCFKAGLYVMHLAFKENVSIYFELSFDNGVTWTTWGTK